MSSQQEVKVSFSGKKSTALVCLSRGDGNERGKYFMTLVSRRVVHTL